jgi:hypothetical protein
LYEKDDESRYLLGDEYPEITTADSKSASTINLDIAAFVSRTLQRFRAEAIARSEEKREILRKTPKMSTVWDDISISFDVVLFCDDLLILNSNWKLRCSAAPTQTTVRKPSIFFSPSRFALELHDLFRWGSRYLEFISGIALRTCILNRPNH